MQYDQLAYVPESDDPSVTIETERLVARIIDNTGLLAPAPPAGTTSYLWPGPFLPFTHHLGYHGIRTLYDKAERRNVVAPLVSWLNLQGVTMAGIELDSVDERACSGKGRGWPMRSERRGKGVALVIDPLPGLRMRYDIEFQPAEPDAIDFAVRFEFGRAPESGPRRFGASWPCYMNAYDDVRFHYPRRSGEGWEWTQIGEPPDVVIGETVGYEHRQDTFTPEDAAMPLGYGRIGEHALVLMFRDPTVRFFMVNAGGHMFFSPVQNPAWDFWWGMEDYPLGEPVGFEGRLVYTRFDGPDAVMARYEEWRAEPEN